jgi:hypothetical protein
MVTTSKNLRSVALTKRKVTHGVGGACESVSPFVAIDENNSASIRTVLRLGVRVAVVAAPAVGQEWKARWKPKPDAGIIEIEVEDITIRAGSGADANLIAAIVQAPKDWRHWCARRWRLGSGLCF